jgi:hypothetical protein
VCPALSIVKMFTWDLKLPLPQHAILFLQTRLRKRRFELPQLGHACLV